ncbi:UNVERIFIED_ORG: hypothetical protein ABIB63_004188 [Xanthomonas axonopodis]
MQGTPSCCRRHSRRRTYFCQARANRHCAGACWVPARSHLHSSMPCVAIPANVHSGLSRHTCENDSQNPISFVKTGSCQIKRRFHRSSTTSSLLSFGTLQLSCGDCARPVGRRVGIGGCPRLNSRERKDYSGVHAPGLRAGRNLRKNSLLTASYPTLRVGRDSCKKTAQSELTRCQKRVLYEFPPTLDIIDPSFGS